MERKHCWVLAFARTIPVMEDLGRKLSFAQYGFETRAFMFIYIYNPLVYHRKKSIIFPSADGAFEGYHPKIERQEAVG